MLIKYTIYYIIARGAPGLVSLLSLIVYTRLLTTDEYGQVALILTGVGFINVIFYQWLHLVMGRFYQTNNSYDNNVLCYIMAIFILISFILLSIGLSLCLFLINEKNKNDLWLTIFLSIALCWLELSLKLVSLRFEPAVYGKMLITKNLIGLMISCSLIWSGVNSEAPILGLITGAIIAWFIFGRKKWKGVVPRLPERKIFNEYISYGWPLSATFALGWVISSSDRMIISFLINDSATGAYSAGYELAQQTIGLLLIIINTAAYPLVIREYNLNGRVGVSRQLEVNGELVITIALVSSAGMIALAPLIIGNIIGPEFRDDGLKIFPWIAISAAISGIKAFHLDLVFQLGKETKWQLYTYIIAAIVNVILNFTLIPQIGLLGAAISTLIAFSVAFVLSWYFGRSIFPVPPMFFSVIRAGFVSIFTYISILFIVELYSNKLTDLVFGCFIGLIGAVASGLLINICDIRKKLYFQINKIRSH
jgi:O-antigen/teichoic acid export membrane protein